MVDRRNLIAGVVCCAAAAAGVTLVPRRRISLMSQLRLEDLAPATFGAWTSRDVTDLVAPKVPGSLASRLYDQTMERIYQSSIDGSQVMVLLAHGDTQSNSLQLHRPEVCYPAFGFEISGVSRQMVLLAPGAPLPSTRLVADAPGRRENIVYWTRLGDFLPTTGAEQRLDRIRTVIGGYIADGLLARFSVVADDSASAFETAKTFVSTFIRAVAPAHRSALIGSRLAAAMGKSQSPAVAPGIH